MAALAAVDVMLSELDGILRREWCRRATECSMREGNYSSGASTSSTLHADYPHVEVGAETEPGGKQAVSHFRSHYIVCLGLRKCQQLLSKAAEAEASNQCLSEIVAQLSGLDDVNCCAPNNETRCYWQTIKLPGLISKPSPTSGATEERREQAHDVLL